MQPVQQKIDKVGDLSPSDLSLIKHLCQSYGFCTDVVPDEKENLVKAYFNPLLNKFVKSMNYMGIEVRFVSLYDSTRSKGNGN